MTGVVKLASVIIIEDMTEDFGIAVEKVLADVFVVKELAFCGAWERNYRKII